MTHSIRTIFKRFSPVIAVLGTTMMAPTAAHAIQVKVHGEIVGKNVKFTGVSDLGIISRKGKVTGKLSTGENCSGNVTIDGAFKNGTGRISCGKLSANFTYTLSSRTPPKGKGGGKTNKGDTITFRFGD